MRSTPSPEPPVPTFGPCTFGAFNTAFIEMAADAGAVWNLLFQRSAWIPGFAGKSRVDGPDGAVGERAHFRGHDAAGTVHTRLEEILALEPQRRLVQRLALADDSATTAFADWRLLPTARGCRLELSLFWLDVPQPGMDWPAVQSLRAGYMAATQALIEAHLTRLQEALARS